MKKAIFMFFLSLIVILSFGQQNIHERIPGPSKDLKQGDAPLTSISVTSLSGSVDATDLVEAILGPGITYSNVSFTGSSGEGTSSAGLFSNGTAAGLGFNSGIILASGYIQNAIGPNAGEATGTNLGNVGDGDLDGLIPGYSTYDATVLEFDFSLAATSINIEFVFGSDEYTEWVGSAYNDVFGFFLDGTNVALIPSTTTPISINNVNAGSNSSYYIDNDPISGTYDIECDGFTVSITLTVDLDPEEEDHHIKLAIADAGDHVLDSWVFLKESGFYIPIEVDLGPDITICEGGSATLDAGYFENGTYLWSTSETTQTITVDETGNYSVTVTTPYDTDDDDINVTVSVLSMDAGSNQTVYYGYDPMSCATLTCSEPTGGTPPYSYLWSTNETTASITVCPTETTVYTVTATDANGCTVTDEVTVCVIDVRCGKKMDKVLVCHIPPDNPDNENTICIAPSAVPDHLLHGDYLGNCGTDASCNDEDKPMEINTYSTAWNEITMSVSPNPSSSSTCIRFSVPTEGSVSLALSDIMGRTVASLFKGKAYPDQEYKIDVTGSRYPSGIYYCTLRHSSGEAMVVKLVISR